MTDFDPVSQPGPALRRWPFCLGQRTRLGIDYISKKNPSHDKALASSFAFQVHRSIGKRWWLDSLNQNTVPSLER
jgi:hypothetical protein